MKSYNKILFRESSKWGLILGVTLYALDIASSGFGTFMALLCTILQIIAIFVVNMTLGAKMKGLKGKYTYDDSMKTIITTMVFAGIIVGAGQFLLRFNNPEYFDNIIELQMQRFANNPDYLQIIEEQRGAIEKVLNNPIILIIASIINMILIGGIVGLINSAYLRNDRKIS